MVFFFQQSLASGTIFFKAWFSTFNIFPPSFRRSIKKVKSQSIPIHCCEVKAYVLHPSVPSSSWNSFSGRTLNLIDLFVFLSLCWKTLNSAEEKILFRLSLSPLALWFFLHTLKTESRISFLSHFLSADDRMCVLVSPRHSAHLPRADILSHFCHLLNASVEAKHSLMFLHLCVRVRACLFVCEQQRYHTQQATLRCLRFTSPGRGGGIEGGDGYRVARVSRGSS